MNDTQDQLAKTYLKYFEANERFERRPSDRTKRETRRELRKLIALAKQRQDEISKTYEAILEEYRATQKWSKKK